MSTCINLLVIEDKPADFRLIVRHLEKHGLAARCQCVTNREEMEAAVEQGGWNVVLSDYSVPKLDFQHTLGILQMRHPDLPLILVSGSIGEEKAVELLKLGVWDFVLKDNLTRLVPAIERSLKDAVDRLVRRTAEPALYESEEWHRIILQTAMDGFWLADIQGRLLEVNETYCRMSGYSAQELLAMRIPDLEANEAAHDTAARIQKIVTQGEDRFESRHRRKDGSIFDVEVSVQHQPGGDGRMVAFLQDITARKQAEELLKTSQENLLLATEGAKLGVWNWNTVTGELIWSDRCKALFGIRPDEAMSYQRFLDALHPDDREMADLATKGALDQHSDYELEYRSLWPDGSLHWLEAKGRGYYDATGRATRMEGVVLDITDRKQVETAMRQKCTDLERHHKVTVGRELCMIELKAEINALLKAAGRPDKYKIV